jgi:hypothetical protein
MKLEQLAPFINPGNLNEKTSHICMEVRPCTILLEDQISMMIVFSNLQIQKGLEYI